RDSGKQTTRPRVTQDLRAQLNVGGGLRIAADGSGSNRRVRANLELIADQILQPAIAVDHQDDVSRLSTNLQPQAAARQGEKRGRGPSVGAVPTKNAAAAHATYHQTRFDRAWEDGNARRLAENRSRDRLVLRGHDLAEDRRRIADTLRLVVVLLR